MSCTAIDGDTLSCSGERIRVLGVNTPERGCHGAADAQQFLGRIAATSVLIFERLGRDRYGRTLARVWVNAQAPGHLLAEWIISAGLGERYGDPNRVSPGRDLPPRRACAR